MNIFALDDNPKLAAQAHLDKHIVKMIIEYAQLLSTAHRVIDGKLTEFEKPSGKVQKILLLSGEKVFFDESAKIPKYRIENPKCYSASHVNHPSGVWARESDSNYLWLYQLFEATAIEYTHRYGKAHKTWLALKDTLRVAPRNIAAGDRTEFAVAMPDEYRVPNDPIASYKNYYLGSKARFARWTNRKPPSWFIAGTKDYDASNFERTT